MDSKLHIELIALRDSLREDTRTLNALLKKDDKRFQRSNERLYTRRETIVDIGKKLTLILESTDDAGL